MNFFDAWWSEAQLARTAWLLGLFALTLFLGRAMGTKSFRFRTLAFFLSMHLILVTVAAAMEAQGSPVASDVRTPSLIFAAVCFVGAGAALLFDVLLPRVRLTVPRIVEDVIVALLSVGIGVTVASRQGVNLSGIIATSAVFTAVLGFSLQDVISNVAGGLALQIDNSVEVGDWIKTGDITGRVVDIRWRYTSVETRNWETVLVPNSMLMKNQVTVLGRRQGQPKLWRRWVYFSVDYRHQPSDVIEAVQNAFRGVKIERVATDPAPNCVFMEMTESAGKYAMRYWLTDLAADDPTDSEVRTRIFFALHRTGMKPAIPAHAVFVHQDDAAHQQEKAQRDNARRRALLEQIDLFQSLSGQEREALAPLLKYAPFTRGETITKQGAEAHWLYIVEDGTASIRVTDGELQKEVAKLRNQTFFGEMGLLTGAPRSATVVAETDVECFRLDKEAFRKILEARPELARHLAELLAKRQVELLAVKEGLDAEGAKLRQANASADLVKRIRSFFSLS